MDKTFYLGILGIFASLLLISVASAACTLNAELINQDPYPASPGEYVKIVFQVTGVENPECGTATFELLPEFPFSLDPGADPIAKIKTGTYVSDFKDVWVIPYKIRVDKGAIDGENKLKVKYAYNSENPDPLFIFQDFNISINNSVTNFEVSVKDYVKSSNTLTFEILNIGGNDVEALTIEIPVQDNIDVKGSRRNIVGSLDNNDDTTFTFEAVPKQGEIRLVILYNDRLNVRHQMEKSVMFNAEDFESRVRDKKSNTGLYILILVLILVIGIIFWRRRQNKKKLDHLKNRQLR